MRIRRILLRNMSRIKYIIEGYEWVDLLVRKHFSKFRWSRILNSWLNNIYVFESEVSEDIMSLRWESAIDHVCQDREGYDEKFFYVYIAFFVQLHIQLPF